MKIIVYNYSFYLTIIRARGNTVDALCYRPEVRGLETDEVIEFHEYT
jgi:hypothetical protein